MIYLSADISTNAWFLTRDVFDKLISWGVRTYMITIDGVGEMHDRTRDLAGGQGTFDRIIENLKAVKESDEEFDITIRVNFGRENMKEVSELIKFVRDHFSDDQRFGMFFRSWEMGGKNDDELPICNHIISNQKNRDFQEEAVQQGVGVSNCSWIYDANRIRLLCS